MEIAVTHSMYWYLQNSVYNQRGWTLQELVLPRRTLIFINNRVYFRCTQATWCEDTAADLQVNWADPDDGCILRPPGPGAGNLDAWETYQKLCEDYSDRTLTHDGDALRALSGILRLLGGDLTSWYADGLPANYLDIGLLFLSTDGTLRRRPGFASYSWAGWSGPITWPPETRQGPDHGGQTAERLFDWIQKRTFAPWRVWTREGSVDNVNNIDAYNQLTRTERFVDRYSNVLTEETRAFLKLSQSVENYFPLARQSASCTSFPLPCFTQGKRYGQEKGGGGLYCYDVLNSQAEVDRWAYGFKEQIAWWVLISWLGCRGTKSRNCEARELRGPTTFRREGDELDYEFRDSPGSQIREISCRGFVESCNGYVKPFDARVENAMRAIDGLREANEQPVPELPTFPIYPVIQFRALFIRLITGPPPTLESRQDPSLKTLPRHQRPPQWVKGSPLFSRDGELVGSLHLDDVASHTAGMEVECAIMAYSKEPVAGSALPTPQKSVSDDEEWSLFWIMYVVEKEGIHERRGVGQVLDSVLAKSCVRSEGKVILLG
ncbi:hypothetical protein ACHAPT_009210 [Fusarium lateritium]